MRATFHKRGCCRPTHRHSNEDALQHNDEKGHPKDSQVGTFKTGCYSWRFPSISLLHLWCYHTHFAFLLSPPVSLHRTQLSKQLPIWKQAICSDLKNVHGKYHTISSSISKSPSSGLSTCAVSSSALAYRPCNSLDRGQCAGIYANLTTSIQAEKVC